MIVRRDDEDAGDVLARACDLAPLAPFERIIVQVCFRPAGGGVCRNCVPDHEGVGEAGEPVTVWRCPAGDPR